MKLKLRCLCLTKTALKKIFFNSSFSSFSDHLYQPSLHFSPFQPGKHEQPSVKKNNTLIYSCLLNCSSVKYHVKYQSSPHPPPKKKKITFNKYIPSC